MKKIKLKCSVCVGAILAKEPCEYTLNLHDNTELDLERMKADMIKGCLCLLAGDPFAKWEEVT